MFKVIHFLCDSKHPVLLGLSVFVFFSINQNPFISHYHINFQNFGSRKIPQCFKFTRCFGSIQSVKKGETELKVAKSVLERSKSDLKKIFNHVYANGVKNMQYGCPPFPYLLFLLCWQMYRSH